MELNGIGRFNVLIGRNNSGKSAILGALLLLSRSVLNEPVDFERVLPARHPERSLKITLTFELGLEERREFISLLQNEGYHHPDRRQVMLDGPLLRRIHFVFRAPEGRPELLHLKETKLWGEDDSWATVQRAPESGDSLPESKVTYIGEVSRTYRDRALGFEALDVSKAPATGGLFLLFSSLAGPLGPDPATRWPYNRLADYLAGAFFFDPFRHSEERRPVRPATKLDQTGANLAQILHTVSSNAPPKFQKIEEFVRAALPDAGVLHTPIRDTGGANYAETGVGFLAPDGGYTLPLRDMGGGVEQLLMAAVVLLTTGDDRPLFLEEPEGHLHAGAQRYLIEKLHEGERQVFVTTHSPTFVNQSRPKSLYRVSLSDGSTSVSKVEKQGDLGGVLEDIGARNSDVLLSDAALFVEGKGDRQAFSAWADTLGLGLTERNVAVLPMGGGEHVARGARPRSEVLEGISDAAPVPHVFVVDRDERPEREVEKLLTDLGDKLHVLKRRELENYLLVPRAIKEALRSKHPDNGSLLERLAQATDEEVQQIMDSASEDLHGLVLLNRVRAEVPGLRDGFMTRDIASQLASRADEESLAAEIHEALKGRLADHLSEIDLATVVRQHRDGLREEWSDPQSRPDLAPGTEVLEEVFAHFGCKYNKSKDAGRVARHMLREEIPAEIKDLLARVAGLADRE